MDIALFWTQIIDSRLVNLTFVENIKKIINIKEELSIRIIRLGTDIKLTKLSLNVSI